MSLKTKTFLLWQQRNICSDSGWRQEMTGGSEATLLLSWPGLQSSLRSGPRGLCCLDRADTAGPNQPEQQHRGPARRRGQACCREKMSPPGLLLEAQKHSQQRGAPTCQRAWGRRVKGPSLWRIGRCRAHHRRVDSPSQCHLDVCLSLVNPDLNETFSNRKFGGV